MNNQLVIGTFIKQLDECLEDILAVYPETVHDNRFLKCKMYFDTLKKTNPRLLIQVWKVYVNEKFRKQIDAGDLNFFAERDYREDTDRAKDTEVESAINDLRTTIRTMSEENINKSMKYIQNLCKLSDLYEM